MALAITGVVVSGGLLAAHSAGVFPPNSIGASRPVAATLTLVTPETNTLTPTVRVQTDHAKVLKVTALTGGLQIAGSFSKNEWIPSKPLSYATTYTLQVTAEGGSPLRRLKRSVTWTTELPPISLSYTINPVNGQQVGMGTTWEISFKNPVPANLQNQIIQAISTTQSIPDPVGWHWWSSTELDGRPQNFWPLNEVETLHFNVDGLTYNNMRIANSNSTVSFTVINQHLTKISAVTHQMQVYNGNQLIRTEPVSLGRPGFPTLSGTLVVLYKSPVVFMNSATIGYPGLYAENVYNDVAISSDGYFIHDAPWDVYDHGKYNVSFGCVEQNPADSVWFYNFSVPGDVVIITGTSYQASEADGEGDWNIPWSSFTVPSSEVSPAPTTAQ